MAGILYKGVHFDGLTYYAGSGLNIPASADSQKGLVNYWYNQPVPVPAGISQTILATHSPGSAPFSTSNILLYVTHNATGGSGTYPQLAMTRQPGVAGGGEQFASLGIGAQIIHDGNWHCVTIAWDLSQVQSNGMPLVQFAHAGILSAAVGTTGSRGWAYGVYGLNYGNTTWWVGSTPYLPAGTDKAYLGELANVFCHLYDGAYIDPVNSPTPPYTEMCKRIIYGGVEVYEPNIIGQDTVGQRIFGVVPTIHLIGDINVNGSGHNAGPLFLANNGKPFVLGAGAKTPSATTPIGPGPHP